MQKKSYLIVALIVVAMVSFALGAYAGDSIKIIVNGSELRSDVPAQIVEGRTMVPLRFVAEALGASVEWDDTTKSVIITSEASTQQQKYEFDGKGNDHTEKIKLREGLASINYKYTGESNFIVWLLDGSGNKVELIANEIGTISGKKAVSVKAGTYLFNVDAEGSWSITVEQ